MVFSSAIFLFVFLPVVCALYFILPGIKTKNILLIIASLIFYAFGEPVYVLLMISSIIFNYIFGLFEGKFSDSGSIVGKRIVLVLAVIVNIGMLCVFKYTSFILENVNYIGNLKIKIPAIALPIGISFFTFQALSYVIDVYRNPELMQKNLFNLMLYVSFFPQLIAGPIIRYNEIANQINKRESTIDKTAEGIRRFIIGLTKKLIIANATGYVADAIFKLDISDYNFIVAWVGAITYTLQIYYDFSGYSDMAIGMAKIFGFEFRENFNHPYSAKGIKDFWRRWHISLTTWFRDYIYIPLGGSRVGKWKSVRNTFIIFLVSGFWHGANWTFICWGLFHALLFLPLLLTSSNRKYRGIVAEGKLLPSWKEAIQIGTTFFLVVIGWILFRAENMEQAIGYIRRLFSMQQSTGNMPSHSLEVGLYILLFWILEWFQRDKPYALQIQFLKSKSLRVAILTFVILFIEITMGKSSEFIYFQF